MYQVLLVDDELLVREGIKTIIPWEELGFSLIGDCNDGQEAMDFLLQTRVDLVITDICMPYVTGIELAKYIYEKDPTIKVVILSGFDEFEYAKQALKYQVMEYILKPVTSTELAVTLSDIKMKLDEEKVSRQNLNKIKTLYHSNSLLIKSRFLNNLLLLQPSASTISDAFDMFSFSLLGPYFSTIIFEADKFCLFSGEKDGGYHLAQFTVFNIAKELISKKLCGEVVQNQEGETVIILSSLTFELLEGVTEQVINEISTYLNQQFSILLTISVGRPVYRLHQLPLSYENARSLLEYRFLMGTGNLFHYKDFEGKIPNHNINRNEWSEKILLSIKGNQREELDYFISAYMNELKIHRLVKSQVMIYVQNLILCILNMLERTGIQLEGDCICEQELLTKIHCQKHLPEMEVTLQQFCHQAADAIYSKKEDFGKKQSLLALDYINKHYQDPELSLQSICSYLSISASYFSMIFKSYTGETFVETLTKKRMEVAMDLIANTSMKNYEVSSAVGYVDPHYFSTTFKKHIKMTPSEYAKQMRRGQYEVLSPN